MSLQEIYRYFQSPHPIYLSKEVATCYILSVLIEEGDSYCTALMKYIEEKYPPHHVSDTVLWSVLPFLIDDDFIFTYWENPPGKGRPRKMFSVMPEKLDEARRIAHLWHQFLGDNRESATVDVSWEIPETTCSTVLLA